MFLQTNKFLLLGVFSVTLFLEIDVSRADIVGDTTRFASANTYQSGSTDDERKQAKTTLDTINKYCKALQVSSVLRHGTRNPSSGDIDNANNVLNKFKATGSNSSDLQELSDVLAQFPISSQGKLIQTGVLEHQGIGSRMVDNFPTLLSQASLSDLSFSATSVTRTVDSCNAFQTGFFAQHGRSMTAPITTRDDILRFFDKCDAYQKLVASSSTQRESQIFQNSTYPTIIQNYINGFPLPPVSVSFGEMSSIYQLGAIEYAALNSTHWAEYITDADRLSMEYFNDLMLYYSLGYGFKLNYDMSCPLLSTLFHDMDKVYNGNSYLKGLFYFSHAETITPLFDILGLYKDSQPLTASNYAQQTNRQFRTGRIVPFSSNIAFVQYDCDVQSITNDLSQIPAGIFPSNPQRNMTLMLVKEAPTKYPACDSLVCPYSTVRQFYSQLIDNCDYNSICGNSATTTTTTASSRPSSASVMHIRNSLVQLIPVCLIVALVKHV